MKFSVADWSAFEFVNLLDLCGSFLFSFFFSEGRVKLLSWAQVISSSEVCGLGIRLVYRRWVYTAMKRPGKHPEAGIRILNSAPLIRGATPLLQRMVSLSLSLSLSFSLSLSLLWGFKIVFVRPAANTTTCHTPSTRAHRHSHECSLSHPNPLALSLSLSVCLSVCLSLSLSLPLSFCQAR